MDPQATIELMKDCIKSNDHDGFNEAVDNLHRWLKIGGFPPVVTFETFGTNLLIARWHNRTIHIQSFQGIDIGCNDNKGKFELSVYDVNGDFVESFRLG